MSTTNAVRRATPEDAEELVRLRTIMLDSLHRSDDRGWQSHAVEILRKRLAAPDGDFAVFVVDRPGKDGTEARDDGTGMGDVGTGTGSPATGTGDASAGTSHPATRTGAPRSGGAPAPALAACAAGTVEHRLPGPGNPLGHVGHVFNVATDPDLRRRGYSRACMTALLAWYRERGVRKIDLHASVEGEPLYASMGFVRNAAPAMRLTY